MLVPFYITQQPTWWNHLTQHELGPLMLFSAVILQIIGFLSVRWLLRIEL